MVEKRNDAHPDSIGEYSFSFEAGMLLVPRVRTKIKEVAFMHKLEVEIQEEKGFLMTTFLVRMRGNEMSAQVAREEMHRFAEEHGAM